MKRAQPEHRAQVAIVEYLRLRGFWPIAIPNGGKLFGDKHQRERTGWLLKASGLHAGFPDLAVIASKGRIGFIEVKAEGAYQQPAQKECQQRLGENGHHYAVCRSIDDVEETLAEWGWITPLRAPDGSKLAPRTAGEGRMSEGWFLWGLAIGYARLMREEMGLEPHPALERGR